MCGRLRQQWGDGWSSGGRELKKWERGVGGGRVEEGGLNKGVEERGCSKQWGVEEKAVEEGEVW